MSHFYMEVLSMKSPKNIVKAFTLTSLIVSSISAMADAKTSAAANPVAAATVPEVFG